MAKLTPGTFSTYDLTTREKLSGAVLTGDQEMLIQNDIAGIAEQIMNNEYDPAEPLKFVQQDAFLKGQLGAYRVLLDRSKESAKLLQNLPPQT